MSINAIDGHRLRALRELKGLRTQQALAALVKVSQSHICDFEKGKLRNPEVFVKIADELDCTADFLFRRGPFRNADAPDELRKAASQMALEIFTDRINVTPLQRERCQRVLGHPDAPVTSQGWKSLTEIVELAIGSPPPHLGLARA